MSPHSFSPRSAPEPAEFPPASAAGGSELRDAVHLYLCDREALQRRYDTAGSPARLERMERFHTGWLAALEDSEFEALGEEGRLDWLLFRNRLRHELRLLERERRLDAEMAPLLPFGERLYALLEARREHREVDPEAAAAALAGIPPAVEAARRAVDAASGTPRAPAARAAARTDSLLESLGRWHGFYTGYDPVFTWWAAAPFRAAEESLRGWAAFLRERVVGTAPGGEEPVVGEPIGAEGLREDLDHEMIPYRPAELADLAAAELAWCEAALRAAAAEMGRGGDWKAALELVKQRHVAPGRQPALVRDLAREAEAFVEERGLITVPPLAKEVWRLEMMSPEAQRVNPYFLGGEVIRVSFPTGEMAHDEKRMSLRANNVPFARATVQHELIPGHHLQGFMTARWNPHRRAFATPFWTEGWALHWEMLLWEEGFARTPEERVGMLFWRLHRAARVHFSLRFHLGEMSPEEAVAFLVNRVGHEPAAAAAEVRRSFNGSYPPLYQAAYLIGGLQFRALFRELAGGGGWTARAFHDAVLRGGPMPVEMVRARLRGERLERDRAPSWRFGERAASI